ncbi:MAG: hypothetical protein R6T96_03905, partial [Longimicrobiales bacterium]
MKTSSGERRTGALEAPAPRPLSALLAPPPDEWANALTHGLGTLAALAGGIVLVVLAAVTG